MNAESFSEFGMRAECLPYVHAPVGSAWFNSYVLWFASPNRFCLAPTVVETEEGGHGMVLWFVVSRCLQGKGLAESSAMEVKDNASKTSPAINEAISLEPPSHGKNERVEGTATLSTCGPRYPPPVIQQPRPCVAIMKAGEAAAEVTGRGDSEGGPGRACGQTTEPQVLFSCHHRLLRS